MKVISDLIMKQISTGNLYQPDTTFKHHLPFASRGTNSTCCCSKQKLNPKRES